MLLCRQAKDLARCQANAGRGRIRKQGLTSISTPYNILVGGQLTIRQPLQVQMHRAQSPQVNGWRNGSTFVAVYSPLFA